MAQPEKAFRCGACGVSIFVNELMKNGQPVEVKKAVFTRSYKDREGNWKDSNSLDVNDIPKAVMALLKAYDYLTDKNKAGTESVP